MSGQQRINHFTKIEIKPEIIGFVLGKGKSNLNNLKKKYPTVNIKFFNGRGCIEFNLSTNVFSQLNSCEQELRNYISKAEGIYSNIQYKNKMNKDRKKRIKSNQATRQLREQITSELHNKKQFEKELEEIGKQSLQNEDILSNNSNNNSNSNSDSNSDSNSNSNSDSNSASNLNNDSSKKQLINHKKIKSNLEDEKFINKVLKYNKFAGLDDYE
tara:strand:- start:1999 stop:2640 length:642 start_codon:yes stop_codon:yes gene_type:complete